MYNRYIPQPDGSYSRRRVQEPSHPARQPQQRPAPAHQEPPCAPSPLPDCEKRDEPQKPLRENHTTPSSRQESSALGFLKQLLPKDFDTSDLLIVLLLLLMAGDCAEDQNTALLTLALYFFM